MDWGGLIGGITGTMGAIFGGFANRKKAAEMRKLVNQAKADNENWYKRRYNEDVTQRADAQRILNMTEEAIKRRNQAARGRQIVMGSPEEGVAAEKEQNNKAYSDVMSQIAAAGEQRKDAIEQQYLNRKERLDDKLLGIEKDEKELLDIAADGHIYGLKGFAAGSSMNNLGGFGGGK